jgi:CRP-like cAMP-binding protein
MSKKTILSTDGVPKTAKIISGTASKPENAIGMLSPNDERVKKWDLFMIFLLSYVSIVTPFEVAFLQTKIDFLFVINRIVDIGFLLDMRLQFMLPLYIHSENLYVWDKSLVRNNYLTGWFIIDLVSIIPYDILALVGASGASSLKILRTVRLLRLVKLARVFKAAKIFSKVQNYFEWTFTMTYLIQMAIICLVIIHWFACFWGMLPALAENEATWITGTSLVHASIEELYVASLEYSLMAMAAGFGDFSPHNSFERAINFFMMIIGSCVYGYALGEICDKTSNLNPAQHEYQQQMDLLNNFMEEVKLPSKRHADFRAFFAFNKTNFKNKFYVETLLDSMSPDLQGALADWQHSNWIKKIPFFNAKNPHERANFVTGIALDLQAAAFAPSEMVYTSGATSDAMYVIQQGLAAQAGNVLSEGKFFGEDFVLHNSRRAFGVRALTFLATYKLEYNALQTILQKGKMHETKRLIRKQAILLAMKAKFMQILTMVRLKPGYKEMTKREVVEWKEIATAHNVIRKYSRRQSSADRLKRKSEIKMEHELSQQEQSAAELEFWLKGHVTGDFGRPENQHLTFDLKKNIRKVARRANRFEKNLNRAKAMAKHGFERIELHLEAQYKTFQDIINKADRLAAKLLAAQNNESSAQTSIKILHAVNNPRNYQGLEERTEYIDDIKEADV